MRIAFNASSLLSPLTGIGQYSRHLALGLAAHNDIDVDFLYGAVWSKEVRETPLPGPASMLPWMRRYVPFSYELRRAVQSFQFSLQHKKQDFDIYHEPNILPLPFDASTVVTVHDLSWIRFPETHPIERVRAMDKYFQRGIDSASLILTDSEFVKQELMEVFGVQPERIRPVLLGVEALFHPRSADQTRTVLDAHGLLHNQYLLTVGTLEPRKNLTVAIRAFMQLPARLRKRFPLVLVGMKGWNNSALELQMAPLVASGEIRLPGYLPREDLATIIAGATTLIYPSIYEGFGLPPLEAMACGVPVIVSDVSSLPEVVGDTGLLIDPQDVDGLASAIKSLVNDPQIRQELSQKALQRSAMFTWARCVEETIDAYRSVLSKS
jgi:glycosyltransferase involved in cell wall biosynthesis